MKVLIADSGSTNTKWSLLNNNKLEVEFTTPGINPFMQDSASISDVLKALMVDVSVPTPDMIYFYGAGCINDEKKAIVNQGLAPIFGTCMMEIESDLLAAARGLCGRREGIACILGTGSNSCYYDGCAIIQNVSPLGFILGDEGSGAVLGRKLIGNILKKQWSAEIVSNFFETFPITPADILERVYRQPYPNRYLAQYTVFIHKHLSSPEVYEMVVDEFRLFLQRNVAQYDASYSLPIHFTGSVAHYFAAPLKQALQQCNMMAGQIIQSPLQGLIQYHLNRE
jgi:N-acetylglucosamine kinase-like BadF-type ATPase